MAGLDDLASQLNAVAVRLREIGEQGLAGELQRAVTGAVAPLPARIRAGLRPHLPDRYADVLDEDLKIGRSTFLGAAGDFARVTVYASPRGLKKRKLSQSNAGFLWHPVFEDRKVWRVNAAPGHGMVVGWFDEPVQASVPEVRAAVERAMDDIVVKAVGKGP